jgi:2-desacetyl-2-hydroxyethyl bacteriochlorophyllide A dehydrogenase
MKRKQILFTGKSQLEVVTNELPALGPDQVLVRTEFSLMSTGTENICFNRLFAPGTHFDKWVKYPFEPGYCTVGVVEEIGANVKKVIIGDRVGHRRGHASHHVVGEDNCFPVPAGIEPDKAIWFPLGHITHNGARNVGFKLGDRVAVIGAGPIGQMTLRWAIACGAEQTLVLDAMKTRLDIAKKGGATYTLGVSAFEAKEQVDELLGGPPDVVVDATGYAPVFEAALGLVKTQGRLLLIGDTGSPAEQRLTPDVVTRALSIHGAHDATRFPDRDPHGIARLFFHLMLSGRFSVEGMNTHYFSPDDAEQAYGVANTSRETTMGIVFRW